MTPPSSPGTSSPPASGSNSSSPVPPQRGSVSVSGRTVWMLGFIVFLVVIGAGILVNKLSERAETTASGAVLGRAAATATRPVVVTTPVPAATPTPDRVIKVYITGAVGQPGVYTMQSGDRVIDAVLLAGGFSPDADQNRVDQAVRVRDEMRIDIPRLASAPLEQATGVSPGAGGVALKTAPAPAATVAGNSRLNINTASAAELDKLPGIGTVISQRIVEYRTKNGPFQTLDDLRKVEGVSRSLIEKIKDLIVF